MSNKDQIEDEINNININQQFISKDDGLKLTNSRRYYRRNSSTRSTEERYRRHEIRSTLDWTHGALSNEHFWQETNSDFCYFYNSKTCQHSGSRKKCSACGIVCHNDCISALIEQSIFCKMTFLEAGPRNYRMYTQQVHEFFYKQKDHGKCSKCFKNFSQKFSFHSKEAISVSCCWCRNSYHLKCFDQELKKEDCSLGLLSNLILPYTCVLKLPKKGTFKSSVKKKRKLSSASSRKFLEDHTFIFKTLPNPNATALAVFINPRSGGCRGKEIMHKLQSLLNPRQIFDLTEMGPKFGLEMFKRLPYFKILACGGDGTVGWILSQIDALNFRYSPPIAIIPLGTGNDLARTLNWGGGYTDEPMIKYLSAVDESSIVQMDRWKIESIPTTISVGSLLEEGGVDHLPLNVMNNYFSIGADAHVTLEFHESREANPDKFSSRFWNKMYYAGVGGKDLLKRSWKDLSEYIRLECDDEDMMTKINHIKCHCILFLNIPRYAAGTVPWRNNATKPQKFDDGYIEVIGFTTATLAGLQIGAHGGIEICQCSNVKITTLKPIPVQIDGEPCRLNPSSITISFHNQVNMLSRNKLTPVQFPSMRFGFENVTGTKINVFVIDEEDYNNYYHSVSQLTDAAKSIGSIYTEIGTNLSLVRKEIDKSLFSVSFSCNWSFIDAVTLMEFFRIDPTLEDQHYLNDILLKDQLYLFVPTIKDNDENSKSGKAHSEISNQSSLKELESNTKIMKQESLSENNYEINDINRSSKYDNLLHDVNSEHSDFASERSELTSNIESLYKDAIDTLPNLYISSGNHQFVQDKSFNNLSNEKYTLVENMNEKNSNNDISPSVNRTKSKILTDNYKTAFLNACKVGNIEKVKYLFKENPGLINLVDKFGYTGLHQAAKFNDLVIAKFFINNGSKELLSRKEFERGQTALHMAAMKNNKEICEWLVEAGANLFITDIEGMTPCDLAIKVGSKDLSIYLRGCFETEI